MFRKMRRGAQNLSQEEIISILNENHSGTLAVLGDDGYPYAVPTSYVYKDGKIYFHSAISGHKIDAIRNCDKASFCVTAQDDVVPEELTTHYKSVIAFGKIKIIEDDAERRRVMDMLAEKYLPISQERIEHEITRMWKAICAIEFDIEHVTGKAAKALMKK